MKRLLVTVAKVAVSAGLIAFLLSRLSLAEISDAMERPRWGWLAAALGVYGLSAVGGAQQWAWILRVSGVAAPVREIRRLYFIGLFFNNFLPANIGGDAWKIVDLGRQEGKPLAVFASTVLDRLLGLTALTLMAVLVLAGAAVSDIPLPQAALLLLPVLAGLAGLLAMLLSRRLGGRAPALLARAGLPGLATRLAGLAEAFAAYRRKVRWLNGLLAFSVGVQLLRIVTHLLVARGLGFTLGGAQAVQLLVLIPLLAISLTLPITINGIGLRESISANLLVWAGLAAPQAVAMEV
ncbi:MAG TPA: lysylphosphatidylglycerol synthase transmembrane domain-containing protein, partial [Candidatus Krumholzibacteria bacterium]|nr:lysylphosphatidylglycerol synthase transmembrane domain-containing protein [Candidatus Krumholzibacteria bacterium]